MRESENTMYDVTVIGNSVIDVLADPFDAEALARGKREVDQIRMSFGGDALNEAVVLARLGKKVQLISKVGADEAGHSILTHLKREGVSTDHVIVEEGAATSINIALIEDSEAMSNYSPVQSQNDSTRNSFISKLQNGLSSNGGAALFVIELRSDLSINVQGKHWNANNTYNICEMVGTDGTFYSALKTANFDGVADIIAARLSGNSWKSSGDTYTSKEYKNAENKSDYRTAPKKKLFQSKALNIGKYEDNTRYTMNVRWTDPDDPYSVEVFLLPNKADWESAYRSDNGTCFSTYGNRGCRKKNK
jgi:hypothetical protein